MGSFVTTINLLVCVLALWIISFCHACISTCQCSTRKQKGRNVNCGSLADPISSLADLKFPPDTVHLDLSFNALVILDQGSFIQLSRLQKLNLSSNKISVVESGAFDGLQNLKKLDLSNNQLDAINSRMFNGLPSLTKLTLSFNHITAIPDGTFQYLTKLKKLEFQSAYLWCDCRLKWMLRWAKRRDVRISASTVCSKPSRMKGKPLAKLKKKELICKAPKPPPFDIRPSESQLVFRGDQLPFECRASVLPGQYDFSINWFRSGHLVKSDKAKGVFVDKAYNQDKTVINHRLVVKSLDMSHAGEWTCVLSTPAGNVSKSVQIQVRTLKSSRCSAATNSTSKGVYIWEETAAGLEVTQPCRVGTGLDAVATHTCGLEGWWTELDISKCGYLRKVTRELAKLASADAETKDIPMLKYTIENAMQMASQEEGEALDALEVFYLANVIESTLLPLAWDSREMAGFLIDLVSNITNLPEKVLRSSQLESLSTSRITIAVTGMLLKMDSDVPTQGWIHRSKDVAVTLRNRERVSQQGLSCTLKKSGDRSSEKEKIGKSFVKESPQLSNLDFSCDDHEDTDEGTGLLSVFIPPAKGFKRDPVIIRNQNNLPVDATGTGDDDSSTATTITTVTPFEPDIDDDISTFPPNLTPADKLDNETIIFLETDEVNDTETSSRLSTQHQTPTPPQSLTNSEADSNSNPSPPRFSRSITRIKRQQPGDTNPNSRLGPPKGFPSFPLSADQLRQWNISTKLLSQFPTLNLSAPSGGSKLPANFDQSVFPFFQIPPSSSGTNTKKLLSPISVSVNADSSTSVEHKNVYVVVYRNGNLFPILKSDAGDPFFQAGTWAVVTPVVEISLGDDRRLNLSTPIAITFEVENTRRPIKAAYFNYPAINGYGGWFADGCEIIYQNGSTVTVQVRHLSAFAILEEISFVFRLASFPMDPVIYVGSGVCALCMLIVINTYICCFGSIGVPKKIKHAVVNLCLSSFLMVVVFALGINRTSMALPCQMVGISLHYFTLSALFWITITANITYKKFVKAGRPPEPPPELGPMPLPPKPILQFYFVGYGVPIIICGITAAVNLDFYAGIKYCFLEWEPSLGAFYAPVALLVAWNLVLFMRISCLVRNASEAEAEAANESEDNEVHNNEIELVPSQPDTTTHTINNGRGGGRHSNHISNSFSQHRYSRAGHDTSSEEDSASLISLPDQERRPITQLRALVAIHFLFIVMWTCGALAIAKPFQLIIPYQELIFSYLYGLMSSLFGIFMLVYFLLTRTDSRLSWKRKFGCAPPETYSAPLEVIDTHMESPTIPLPPPQPTLPIANGNVVKSNSNTNLSVYSQKSSNITKAYNMKNNASKQSNINLILANSSDLSHGSTQDNFPNFYNPRQNGAAKKFWQKNRHHSKVMNKDINRDLNSSLTDNNSGNELNQPRLSHGTSSEANTHLSIEIQIQPKNQSNPGTKKGSFCGSREIPVHISNSHNNMASSCGAISLEHNNNHHNNSSNVNDINAIDSSGDQLAIGLEHNDLSSPSTSRDKQVNITTNTNSNANLPHDQLSPSSGSSSLNTAGNNNHQHHHPSAFTLVQPRPNAAGAGNSNSDGLVVQSSSHDPSSLLEEGNNQKETPPPPAARNQLSGPADPTAFTAGVLPAPDQHQQQQHLQHQSADVANQQQRPPNPGVAWSPFPISLPPMPTNASHHHHPQHHHPNNSTTTNYSFTPPPQYHQVMQQQQHYAFDFGQFVPGPNMSPIPMNNSQSHQPNHNYSPHPLPQYQAPTTISPLPIMPQQTASSNVRSPPPPPHPAANFNIPPSPYLVQNQSYNNNNNNRVPKSMSPVSSSSQSQSHQNHNNRNHHHRHHRRNHSNTNIRPHTSGGDSSDNSSRSRPRHNRSSGGSPRRSSNTGNVYNRSPVTVASDSHASEPLHQLMDSSSNDLALVGPKKAKSVDGDHYSDPTHRKKHKHRQNNKLTNKQRSLGWDEHLKNRTPKINYVYINHMYRDKVMHKLIKQASKSDDLATKAFWLPRSTSEYERLTQKGFCSMADDSSSSSDEDDSLDNIWIPQRSFSDFQKKETSV